MAFPLGFLVLIVLLGVPVSLAIVGGTWLYYLGNDSLPTPLMFQAFVSGIESFPLLAVPLFILAGELMNASGITRKIISFSDNVVGHITGGLGLVNVLANALMGGLSGSSNADAAALSKTLVPEMEKRGYDRAWSSALTASGSIMGPIIPPGIGLVLFGFLADVSIGKLFLGGIVPGILLCIALMIVVYIIAKKRGYRSSREKMASPRELWRSFLDASWALLIPILIIGGIRIGIFTVTEAAAMVVASALVIGFVVYRTLKLKDLIPVFADTARISAVIMLLLAASSTMGRMLSWERVPHQVAEMLTSISENPLVILLIINVSMLIIGCFTEGTANLIIMTPILMPVVESLGIDPVAFGVMFILNLTIGGITPPFGMMMFTVCSLNNVSISDYAKQVWPFVIAVISVLFLITYVPQLVTFLPNLLMP